MWFVFQFASLACWAVVNVLDSLMVRHYQKNGIVIGWCQSCFNIVILMILTLFLKVQTSWMVMLILGGMIAYVGDLVFWKALDLIDVSVTTMAWAILSVFLSIAGFVLFAEIWSLSQVLGSLLVLTGTVLLSLWHRTIERNPAVLLLLPLLALLYVPFYLFQKAALVAGQSTFAVFFWPLIAREGLFFLLPWVVPSFRRAILNYLPQSTPSFYFLSSAVVFLFLAGIFLTTQAYARGPLSLISIVSNVQPFLTLFFAWALWRLIPSFASRELLTLQSVRVKVISFCIVFVGLALLAI